MKIWQTIGYGVICAAGLGAVVLTSGPVAAAAEMTWRVDSSEEWTEACQQLEGVVVNDGLLEPTGKQGVYRSSLRRFPSKQAAQTLTLTPSVRWENWEPTPQKVAPPTLGDAPIFLVKGPRDYWLFGRNKPPRKPKGSGFKPTVTTLEGFDVPLRTTPHPHLFDAPGGLQKGLGGYHAWQSRDMVNWVHHGPVTAGHAKWATTAEFVDGKAYIYYDFPNDQDPHLYVDEDLTDGKPGEDRGRVFLDPSDGSDCAILRGLDGRFHLIYEDWSPIDARKHSWDSPLAGHAVSDDGLGGFAILPPVVDERTKPTGKFAEYPHPHWHQEDPKNFPVTPPGQQAVGRYEVHEPAQNAFGDWGAISIGGQFYLVADYHPAHASIRIGLFTSPSLDQKFELIGELGSGHPDPDIGFAEGRFYLINQTKRDYVSPGPWVEKVEVRVGVDTTNDGKADVWSDWQEVSEQYDFIPGFSKQVKRTPALMDLAALPSGHGFCFEIRLEDTTENTSKPLLDAAEMRFE